MSPTRKLIVQYENRMGEFNINKTLDWNSDNMKKYKTYVNEKFQNKEVLMNLMLLDKQL